MRRDELAVAVAFAAGVIRPLSRTPSERTASAKLDRLFAAAEARSKRCTAAAEAKRARRRARNLKQEATTR